MQAFKRSSIPNYLRSSELYKSLQDNEVNDDEDIVVPLECTKDEGEILSPDDLRSLLVTLRFWMIHELPSFLFEYVFKHPFQSYEVVLSEFYDDIPSLRCIEKVAMEASKEKMMTVAVVNDASYEMFVYLKESGHPWPSRVCDHFAECGNLKMLRYAHSTGAKFTDSTCKKAAGSGSLECFEYLDKNKCLWDWETIDVATRNGHLNCLKYAHENGCALRSEYYEGNEGNVCFLAAMNGHLDCLKYAHEHGVELVELACYFAAMIGALDCVQYCHAQSGTWDVIICEAAAMGGHLHVLKYLHENGCPWNEATCGNAADGGHLGCLIYAHSNGCPWHAQILGTSYQSDFNSEPKFDVIDYLLRCGCAVDENIFYVGDEEQTMQMLLAITEGGQPWTSTILLAVATRGFPSCFAYMITQGCPLVSDICLDAAGYGHLSILKLAIENSCPMPPDTCLNAALYSHLDCLIYAHTHACVIPPNTCEAMLKKGTREVSVPCFQYAHQHGKCSLHKHYTCQAAAAGNLELLQYLHEQGCPWNAKAAVAAAKHNHPQCLEYLLSQGCPHSKSIVIAASKKGREQCLLIAKKYGCV